MTERESLHVYVRIAGYLFVIAYSASGSPSLAAALSAVVTAVCWLPRARIRTRRAALPDPR